MRISPIGFLYRAVEFPERFLLPDEKREKEQLSLSSKLEKSSSLSPKKAQKMDDGEARYLEFRKREIARVRDETEPQVIEKIRAEVESALVRIRSCISPDRFVETVNLGVEGKLAELFALPTFEEWKSGHYS